MKRLTSFLLALVLFASFVLTAAPVVNAASAMTVSDSMVEVLKQEEGFARTPYWDYSQYTVGYGTVCPSDMVDYYTQNGITEAEAEILLRNYLANTENTINKKFIDKYGLTLTQGQFDALVSFTYNCGSGWISETTGTFHNAVKNGVKGSELIRAFSLWCTAGGKILPGLIRRRLSEASMYLENHYSRNAPSNYCYVYYDANGGSVSYRLQGYDSNLGTAPAYTPTYSGNTFQGWYTAQVGGTKVTTLTQALSGSTLYAHWGNTGSGSDSGSGSVTNDILKKGLLITVTGSGVNLRKGPGTNYGIVGRANAGDQFVITEVASGSGYLWGNADGTWVCLTYTNYEQAYAEAEKAEQESTEPPTTEPPTTEPPTVEPNGVPGTVKVDSKLSVRSGAGSSYPVVKYLYNGDRVTVIERVNVDGTYWGNIGDGWVSMDFVVLDVDDPESSDPSATLKITAQPTNVTAAEGSKFSITIGASGDGLSYQWYYKNAGASSYSKSSVTSATYTATMQSNWNSRQMYCKVTDKNGNSVSTNVITLTVGNPVKITTQPQSMTAAVGSKFSTKVVATGDGLTYQWYYKNAGASSYTKSSVTGAAYSGTMQSNWANREIYCTVTDKYGNSVATNVITLTLASAVKITTQPADVVVPSGGKISAKVAATGDGLSYQWYYKNAGASSYSKSSVTSATYTATMQSNWDGRQMYCKVTDKYGNSVTSNTIRFTIGNPVKITAQPQSMTAAVGSKFSTKVVATGDGLTYQWYYKNAGASSYTKSSVTGASYSGTMQSNWANREIYCTVTDKYGNSVATNVITLTLGSAVKITTQPQSVTVSEGGKISTKVVATGDGLTYQWYYKNASASSYSKSSITGATYTATMKSTWDGRTMYCIVKDKYGNTAQTNTITIKLSSKVKITTQPTNLTVPEGGKISTKVVATGEGLTYQWYYKNASASSYSKSSVTSATYTATMQSNWGGRKMYCVVKDKYGNSVQSNTITFTLGNKVKITTQPQNMTAAVGAKFSTKVVATGDGLSYQWYFKNASASTYTKSSVTGATYAGTMQSSWDGRSIYCVVKDKYGNSVQTNTITLKTPTELKITTQPTNLTVAEGGKISTKVVATGEGLTYQWYYKNASASSYSKSSITGATYTATMKSTWDGRTMYCVVADKYGNTVRSNTITITLD